MGEYWRDVKPFLKERRQRHVEKMGTNASRNITKLGFPFTEYPENKQFTIETPKGIVDYWGTTGTWIFRKSRKRGKGLHSLKKCL
ncbi:hypothetical protein [Enterococcus sp. HY326]|uniref:hypothetical protein n=1 Tax=Enterococcus sp. HY326 TaxID=2971265 RepID=UPI00223EF270|nr:hypothetical protein [Enterococcus sp. HY326]